MTLYEALDPAPLPGESVAPALLAALIAERYLSDDEQLAAWLDGWETC